MWVQCQELGSSLQEEVEGAPGVSPAHACVLCECVLCESVLCESVLCESDLCESVLYECVLCEECLL